MSFLKRILGGHGGGHGSGHGNSGNGGHRGGHHGGSRQGEHGGHDARGRDRHGWGWQAPADASGGQGGQRGNVPLSQLACAGCGALNGTEARFCAQCGAAQRGKACSRCHAALAADARFCPGCGTQAA
ncbi:zinc ribbon domain-containing protein [Burkholderia cenocepacia]|uniref:zinc ribbon domain-containing protein n=1 Tax=Burkholderia cenocepacia TaxID=95486 RepID=UPI000F59D1CA|nr:zinc ribbon domain-containing protein [Burkholderia cenocepacia]MBR8511086.1 zinc ribbon domain-containing protein [Burkholderia cenocepacia]MEB2608616.1 zinc ribbon domain-containing protein [Burkholderia cenocepacia]RQV52206.1 zinc ribbon domain-containing protein [Burkholderia cenocepacia]